MNGKERASCAVTDADTGSSRDALLGGRLVIRQPRQGARVAIDTLLLAAAVPARQGDKVLELGAGTGAASLALARRVDGMGVTGIERDSAMVRLANENARLNHLEDVCRFLVNDVARLDPAMHGAFDQVMANPPHLASACADASPDPGRRAAFIEGRGVPLRSWIAAASLALCRRGRFTLIHRADRLVEIVAVLVAKGRFGEVTILPLWPKAGQPARRALISARKGVKGGTQLLPGLVLHREDGRFTDEAEAVLREMAALPLAGRAG